MEKDLHNIWSKGVKITDWFVGRSAYPFDNKCGRGESHYITFGAKNERFIPKTTTLESMEHVLLAKESIQRANLKKKMINFGTTPMDDPRFDQIRKAKPEEKVDYISTTKRVYAPWKNAKMIGEKCAERQKECPDFLLNRKPTNDFAIVPWCEHKFMDDQFLFVGSGRKKINFLRQIRNKSFEFGT